MKALTVCTVPGCGELTTQGRCAECAKDVRSRAYRPPVEKDRHWRKIRANYLKKHPRCECNDCLKLPEKDRPLGTNVDHIISREEGGSHKDENLRTMTQSHHSKRTARDQPGGFNAYRR